MQKVSWDGTASNKWPRAEYFMLGIGSKGAQTHSAICEIVLFFRVIFILLDALYEQKLINAVV